MYYTTRVSTRNFDAYRLCAANVSNEQPCWRLVGSQARDIKLGLGLHLYPDFVFASSEGSGESVHMRYVPKARALVHILSCTGPGIKMLH